MATRADYKDRKKRSEALQFLKDKYGMGTTKAALNKIKNLRSYFRRVHNEYLSKKKSGSDTADVPKPTWFLLQMFRNRPGSSTNHCFSFWMVTR
ncbi:hypothetical protein PR048_025563 [Dryococelus australis]|uniref:MADF domain-containing protein n=1 Tax=Dryococelus australis TaxID=614101 RepID=A0ABQ9GRM9_9NEOP|nr:hypothetical protein PR048_025563 [Dryococelus australis]